MAGRAQKRQAAAGQEIPTTERREQEAGQNSSAMSPSDLVTESACWGTVEIRQKLKNTWTCVMCQMRLASSTNGVVAEVGKVDMTCRTGPGKMRKKIVHSSKTTEPMKESSSQASPGQEAIVRLTSKQIEFLEDNFTTRQWKEPQIENQALSLTQMEILSEVLSARERRQLWA